MLYLIAAVLLRRHRLVAPYYNGAVEEVSFCLPYRSYAEELS